MKTAIQAFGSTVLVGAFAATVGGAPRIAIGASANQEQALDPRTFRIIPRESGPTNYYAVVSEGADSFVRSAYRPPMKTAVVGYEIPEERRRSVAELKWKWRARELPNGGNECASGKGDSAAVIYVTWRRGLRWYTIKYVWSSVGPKGTTCDRKRNVFAAQDTVIMESGGPLGEWRGVRIDPDAEYRNHFENGRQDAKVPDLIGLGIMSDGDQTHSNSGADYGGFVVVTR